LFVNLFFIFAVYVCTDFGQRKSSAHVYAQSLRFINSGHSALHQLLKFFGWHWFSKIVALNQIALLLF